jgi:hypothetical protein
MSQANSVSDELNTGKFRSTFFVFWAACEGSLFFWVVRTIRHSAVIDALVILCGIVGIIGNLQK